MDKFCRKFVEDIFSRYDKDRSNLLEVKELNKWIDEELRSHRYLNQKMMRRNYEIFFAKTDTSGDGKIDRWELHEYCIKNITPE